MNASEFLPLSHSSRGTLRSCPHKFELSKLYVHPKRSSSFVADVGEAIHRGYQRWLETQDTDEAIWALMRSYPVGQNWNFLDDRGLEASVFTMLAMTQTQFSAEFEVAHIRTKQEVLMPAIEVPFQINFVGADNEPITLANGRKVIYRGYIDAILYSSYLDRYRVVDIKTHRNTRSDLSAEYKFHGQQIPYGIVLEFILGHQLERFEVSYMSVFIDILEPSISDYTYMKGREELENWVLNLIIDIRRLNEYIKLGYFPRSEYGCLHYNKVCPFFDVCENTNPETIQKIFLMNQQPAEENDWNPWVVLDVELPGVI